MKKFVITLISILMLLMLVFSMYSYVYADNFALDGHDTAATSSFSDAGTKITGIILSAMRYTGAGIALIALVIIAIKYLYSSPGEKADYKKNLVVYVIGGVGMFSVSTLLSMIEEFSQKIGGE